MDMTAVTRHVKLAVNGTIKGDSGAELPRFVAHVKLVHAGGHSGEGTGIGTTEKDALAQAGRLAKVALEARP